MRLNRFRAPGAAGVLAAGSLLAVLVAAEVTAQEYPGTGVYRKPFLTRGGASIGGYMDLEFLAGENGSTFDQHHFVPFIYAEVSDRVHVASEIEFEHGGFVAGDEETDGEIKVEFATVDFRITEALNLRGGLLLSPLGRLNIFHDAPMLDLTERPLVNRVILPTTLSESGIGVYGNVYLSEAWALDYEAYTVNGFREAAADSGGALHLRDGRGSARADNNDGRAVVARVGVSPRLGTDVGVSVHTGDYDDAGERNLTIVALDARFAQGPVEILGEGAIARADVASTAVDRAKASGFYAEGRLHFLAGAVKALPQSVFTGTVRVDWVDEDGNVSGGDTERLTLGLNFRPTEETVLKNDVLFSRARGSGASAWGDTETGYRFSLATYF